MERPDILIFMSDQHAPQFMSGAGMDIDTPNLDKIKKQGTAFEGAYTACPLCVPARMAMLSGMRASDTGIFTNMDQLPNTIPTFLNCLVAAGYETVLAGRMHFIGQDQRHGFTRRIADDFTNSGYLRPERMKEDFGIHLQTMGYKWCTDVVGGGESPVVGYDEMVVNTVENYLSEPHEKPQCILVGTYGPHFPYVAPKDLFLKYFSDNKIIENLSDGEEIQNPMLQQLQKKVPTELKKACCAAYKGLVEHTDSLVGRVLEKFKEFTVGKGSKKIFVYLSDHGDTVGDHGIFGKKTFYEKSAKIPLIFWGDDICKGCSVASPVSILDLGPTLCEAAGISVPERNRGKSLFQVLKGGEEDTERVVLSESMDKDPMGKWTYGAMLRSKDYKFISYHGYEEYDQLFDMNKNASERENLASACPEICAKFRRLLKEETNPGEAEILQTEHEENAAVFKLVESQTEIPDIERFRGYSGKMKEYPEICVAKLCSEPGKEQISRFTGFPKGGSGK